MEGKRKMREKKEVVPAGRGGEWHDRAQGKSSETDSLGISQGFHGLRRLRNRPFRRGIRYRDHLSRHRHHRTFMRRE
jgi:hypothetical protein